MATTVQERIEEIDAILARGVERTQISGRLVEYNFDSLRRERDRLTRQISTSSQYKRVVFRA